MKKNQYLFLTTIWSFVFLLTGGAILQAQQIDLASVKVEEIKPIVSFAKSSEKTTKVNYSFHQSREVNPYKVEYSFEIVKEANSYSISAKSFLSDLDMRFEEGVEMKAENDGVHYPLQLQEGQRLESATIVYDIQLPANILLTYTIKINNRKVIATETFVFNNQSYTAYLIESDLSLVKSTGGNNKVTSSIERLKDWYIPSLGNVKRERVAEVTRSNSQVEVSKSVMKY